MKEALGNLQRLKLQVRLCSKLAIHCEKVATVQKD